MAMLSSCAVTLEQQWTHSVQEFYHSQQLIHDRTFSLVYCMVGLATTQQDSCRALG